MKKCPFCGADLADEAQFCLYCMTPLGEKEQILPAKRRPKGWLFVLGSIFILAVVILLLWPGAGNEPSDPVMQVTTAPTTATTLPTTGTTIPTTIPTTVPTTVTTVPSSSVTTTPTTKPTTAPTTAKPTTTPTTLPTASNEVQYLYRASKTGDTYYSSQLSDNQVVITGVKNLAADGIYHIPDTIDGKTVIAIISSAFYNSGATEVYIPASVTTIHKFAFFGCPLSDVYFIGKRIYCYEDAFPSGFTLHCAPECQGADYKYYMDYAFDYGATWKEWHNVPLMSATDEYGVVYNYRMSTASDHPGDPNYQNPGNHITITSIHNPSPGRNYHIPATLDGLTVAFIGTKAFSKFGVGSLYIPESMIAISYYAVGALEDLYFCHDLYISRSAAPVVCQFTIHCPKDARCGLNGKLYSEDPKYWDAGSWEEWNGLEMTATDDNGIVYFYRPSTSSDHAADPTYQNPGNHITITGVEVQNSSDIYHIPETLNGMTVAFIGKDAFKGCAFKSVYLPPSVIAVANLAFWDCALTDLYFCHDLYLFSNSIPLVSTLHCPDNARCGPNGTLFSERSSNWGGATWEEWNGEV